MDPLSVAASIIAVAGALYTVSHKLRCCARVLAHAGREVNAVAREMSMFSTLLRSLWATIQRLIPLASEVLDVLKICKDLVRQADENVREFEKFLEDLGPLRDPGNANLIAKAVARLRWLFQRTDLLLLRSKLES